MSQFVIGTAGHIDHGKTALVKALTGTDTDRLEEEIIRGMTIDLGFAFLNDNITIIDVPGHEKFIRNMVAGVSTIHLALLVVAADDGIMPQTIEHINILKLLGIPRGVVALTKCDTIDDNDWLDLVEAEIEDLTAGSFLESAPVIRTSAINNAGIDELKAILAEEAGSAINTVDRGFFRHQVDRVFIKKGFGAVVTGTVISGAVSTGDDVEILPGGGRTKVRSLQSHGTETSTLGMGSRAAINLPNVDSDKLKRGSEVVTPGKLQPTTELIAHLSLLGGTRWQIKHNQRVHLHLGTAELLARISLVSGRKLLPGQEANVIIHCEEPLVAAVEDRFVIRSYSPMETIGGGVVLDAHPELKGRALRVWTKDLAVDLHERFMQYVNQDWRRPLTPSQWSSRFALSESQLDLCISDNELLTDRDSGVIYNSDCLVMGKKLVVDYLTEFHRKNPYRKNLSRQALISELQLSPVWFGILARYLVEESTLVGDRGGYALARHSVELSESDQIAADKIENVLKSAGLVPPTLTELPGLAGTTPNKVLELLYVLKDNDTVIEIQPGFWLHTDWLKELKARLKVHFAQQKELSVVVFKEITGTTRKTAIPLLEYCDATQITFRLGDVREAGKALV